jgi:hypothetical protein
MSAPAKGKRPHKKPLNKLEAHEIAEIDKLIEIRRRQQQEQQQEEGRRLFREDEEELQRLMRVSPETPWPQRLGPGVTSGGDGFHYVIAAPAANWREAAGRGNRDSALVLFRRQSSRGMPAVRNRGCLPEIGSRESGATEAQPWPQSK